MKTIISLAIGLGVAMSALAQRSPQLSPDTAAAVGRAIVDRIIGERGPNHREWLKIMVETNAFGEVTTTTNRAYVELQTGMYFVDALGQLRESSEVIEIRPSGGAAAVQGQHQAYFPADIYEGVIEVVTADGRRLKNRPAFISYFDGTNNVLIAQLINSAGLLLPSGNQVIWTNAFAGVSADLLVTYSRSGLEADVVFRAAPPAPENYRGLNANSARLQLWTEWFETADPELGVPVTSSEDGLTDRTLKFGTMQMVRGSAFGIGIDTAEGAEDDAARARHGSSPVYKTWQHMEGRSFLIEELPYHRVRKRFERLGAASDSTNRTASADSLLDKVSPTVLLPPVRLVQGRTNAAIQLAKMDLSARPGVVWDYVLLNGTTNALTLQGNTTYYIAGAYYVDGTVTIEGGAVVKYTNSSSAHIDAISVHCKTEAYRPAVFTAKDDNSVGETIQGSTGNPSGYYGYGLALLTASTVKHVRASYLNAAVDVGDSDAFKFSDVQIVNCLNAFRGADYAQVTVENGLFFQVGNVLGNVLAWTFRGSQLTTHKCNTFAYTIDDENEASSVFLTNSLLVSVTNLASNPYVNLYTNTVAFGGDDSVFQTIGAGGHYLATNSPYRDAGTTSINPELLASLRRKTTYPPVVYSNVTFTSDLVLAPQATRDTDTPDLGFHYDPIDYLTDNVVITNASLTLTNGVAIACYHNAGLALWNGAALSSVGTATAPNWSTRYNCVQEQPVKIGSSSGASLYAYQSPSMTANFRFTKFSAMAGAGGYHLYNASSHRITNLFVRDCELYGSSVYLIGLTNTGVWFDNNLLFRMPFLALLSSGTNWLGFSNNLCFGTTLRPGSGASSNLWSFYNNAFDQCLFAPITTNHVTLNGHNAYINSTNRLNPTNANDLVLTNLTYQTGPMGYFHQPTNSPLINTGSTNANLLGLYHYTTTTNQVKEAASTVDIGYHYVAVDGNGIPVDTDLDGLPDYLEDTNGNGDGDDDPGSWLLNSYNGLTSSSKLQVFTPLRP